jgi:hypothetical protein
MASWLSKSYCSCLICLSYAHGALCYLAFRILRCTTATLTPSSAGQLGRKLREWGIYKYGSKTRSSNIALHSYRGHVDETLGDNLPPAVPERLSISIDLSAPEDQQIYSAFVPDLSTAHTRLLQTADIEYPESYGRAVQTVAHLDESLGFDKEQAGLPDIPNLLDLPDLPEHTEYEHTALTDISSVDFSAAATAASNRLTAGMSISTVRHTNTTDDVPALSAVIEEPENGRLSDVDMDRLSAISLTPSSLSGFASLRSLARRVRLRQNGETSSERNSEADLPSSVMNWRRSSSSFKLFGRLSNRLSIASSQKTGSTRMSWKPEIPTTIQEDDGTGDGYVYGIVQYDFKPEIQNELEAKAGEAIMVIAQSSLEWIVAKPFGRLGGPGLIPVSFIELRYVATGRLVADPQEAMRRAGVPEVEEWKKMDADYKNNVIHLGKLKSAQRQMTSDTGRMSVSKTESQQLPQSSTGYVSGVRPMLVSKNVDEDLQGQQMNQQRPGRGPAHQPTQPYRSSQQQQSRLLAPMSASLPRYCLDNDMYWYIIECQMEDGRHWELSRYYADFYDFQITLLEAFPKEAGNKGAPRILPRMPGPVAHVTDAISNGRRRMLDEYIRQILSMPPHISKCQLVRQFFSPRPGDFEIDPNALGDDYRLSGASERHRRSQTDFPTGHVPPTGLTGPIG